MRSNQQKLMKTLILLMAVSFFTACNNGDKTADKNREKKKDGPVATTELVFDKLAGTWQSEDGKSLERWIKKDDGTFSSTGFSIKGTDTSWNEQASIFPENDKWVFENTVKGQNDEKAVRFVSSSLTANRVQFSNPAHDFPTDINYTVSDANTLNAFIVGPNGKGGKDTIPFNFTRAK
jgi:hypothetical protein